MRTAPLLLPVAIALQACVYNSPVPLAGPEDAVFDEALLGTWLPDESVVELRTAADTLDALLLISRDDGAWYVVTQRRQGDESRGRAYVVVLDGVRFLTLVEDEGDTPVYSFARYTVEGDRLRIRFIADRGSGEDRGLEGTFASAAELRAAVRARLHDPLLFEEDEILLVRRPAMPARR